MPTQNNAGVSATLLLLLLTFSYSAAQAYKPLSYHEKFQKVARAFSQSRAKDTDSANPHASSQHTEMLHLVEEIWRLNPHLVRKAVLDTVATLAADPDSYRRGVGAAKKTVKESALQATKADYETCLNDTASIVIALAERQPWALTMLDAMGKPVPGVTQGNLLWVGSYTLCRSVHSVHSVHSNLSHTFSPSFSGQYCNAYSALEPPEGTSYGVTLGLGLCIPDTCTEQHMTLILNSVLESLGVNRTFGVVCPSHDTQLDTKAIVAIVLCSVLLVLMVVGTLLDVLLLQLPQWKTEAPYASANSHSNNDEHLPLITTTDKSTQRLHHDLDVGVKVLVAFSVYSNAGKLLSSQQAPGSLTCVHGIRFLSMTWVVLGHSFLMPQSAAANFAPFLETSINRWTFQAVVNALVSVDTFFVLSGLLVAYLTLKEMKKKRGKLNWFMFYFHRFWRLTPAYMLVIMVYVCLSPYWGQGPLWSDTNPDRDNCQGSWWVNLLYVNNFARVDKTCLAQSWYLANDMQFYCVLSPLVIIPLYYAPLWGVVVALCLVLAHSVTSAALTMHYNFPPGMYAQVDATDSHLPDWFEDYYIKPYTRWGPYVLGMLAGYFLHVKDCTLHIKWYVNAIIWTVATGSAIAVLYGLYGATTGHPVSVPVSALYNALNRNVWGPVFAGWLLPVSPVMEVSSTQYCRGQPLYHSSRLTYCIYLLHMMIMDLYVLNSESLFYYSDINIVMFFLAVLLVSYMAAFLASLAFEAPMMALEKVVFHRDSPADAKTQHTSNDHGLYQNQNGNSGGQYQNQNGYGGGQYQNQNGYGGGQYQNHNGYGGGQYQNGNIGGRYQNQNGNSGSRYENGHSGRKSRTRMGTPKAGNRSQNGAH